MIFDYIGIYKKFIILCKNWSKYALGAAFFTLIISLLQLPMPFITKYTIDVVYPSRNYSLLNLIIIIMVLFLLINITSNFLSGQLLFLFREKVLMHIKLKLFEHIENLNISYFNNNKMGYLVSRLTSDTSFLQGLMAETVISFFRNVFTFTVGVCALFFLHWKLALISLAIMPFFIYSLYIFSKIIREKTQNMQEKNAKFFEIICESFYSIPVIKLFCMEDIQVKKAQEKYKYYYNALLDYNKTSLFSSAIISFVGGFGPLLIFWIGGREIISGHLTLGGFMAFNGFLGYLYGPIQLFMGLNTAFQSGLMALKRILEIFELPQDRSGNIMITKITNNIEFEDVSFSYNSGNSILRNISLKIMKGDKIAFIGKSGAGKTSLINLICKFYDYQYGKISIDGVDIKNINTNSLRKMIGMVQQTPLLFSGSIRDNILIGNVDATDYDILNAIKIAQLDDFINLLENGLNTEIGERGIKLSGGERQRLAIARVVLKNPELIILDEATSEIDLETENKIQQEIMNIFRNKTIIIITHRLSNSVPLNKLFYLNNGEIRTDEQFKTSYNKIISNKIYYEKKYNTI